MGISDLWKRNVNPHFVQINTMITLWPSWSQWWVVYAVMVGLGIWRPAFSIDCAMLSLKKQIYFMLGYLSRSPWLLGLASVYAVCSTKSGSNVASNNMGVVQSMILGVTLLPNLTIAFSAPKRLPLHWQNQIWTRRPFHQTLTMHPPRLVGAFYGKPLTTLPIPISPLDVFIASEETHTNWEKDILSSAWDACNPKTRTLNYPVSI